MLKRSAPMKRTALRRDTGEARLTVRLSERECDACGKAFQQARTMQAVCSPRCAVRLTKDRAKAERELDKARREKLMTLSDWRKRAQAAFNAYIKQRDAGLPCISCGAPAHDSDQAGHYLSRGAHAELAYDEAYTNRQCVRCNLHKHGNQAMYRAGLIARIGQSEVDRLEGPNPLRHDTADSLRQLAAEYRAKTRQLKARQ